MSKNREPSWLTRMRLVPVTLVAFITMFIANATTAMASVRADVDATCGLADEVIPAIEAPAGEILGLSQGLIITFGVVIAALLLGAVFIPKWRGKLLTALGIIVALGIFLPRTEDILDVFINSGC